MREFRADRVFMGWVSSVLVTPVTGTHLVIADKATSTGYVEELREIGVEVQQV